MPSTPAGIEDRFKELFLSQYKRLRFHAYCLLGSYPLAEDVVEDVFVAVWDNRENMDFDSGVTTYLFRSVTNRSLKVLRHRKISDELFEAISDINEMRLEFLASDDDSSFEIERSELSRIINDAIASLSDKCGRVFQLKYIYGMKHADIAAVMNISVRTVDAHINRALRLLRDKLRHIYLFLIFCNLI